MSKNDTRLQLCNIVKEVSDEWDADIFLYSHQINHKNVDGLMLEVKKIEKRRKNLVLILTTGGGDVDAAFRAASFLKRTYQGGEIILFVFGFCKSAGTLLALAANRIVVSDFGELGPLDVQVLKNEDINYESGLNVYHALESLSNQAVSTFQKFATGILDINQGTGGGYLISLKTAEDIAGKITIGLLGEIAKQVEPLRLGENSRRIQIARQYGYLLNQKIARKCIDDLVGNYPSHDFVIDFEQISQIFGKDVVRKASLLEESLQALMWDNTRFESGIICNLCLALPIDTDSEIKLQEKETKSDFSPNGMQKTKEDSSSTTEPVSSDV